MDPAITSQDDNPGGNDLAKIEDERLSERSPIGSVPAGMRHSPKARAGFTIFDKPH